MPRMRLTDRRVGPQPVALVRICVGLAVVLNAFESWQTLMQLAAGSLSMPTLVPVPAPNAALAGAWCATSVLVGGMLAIGWRAGWAAGLATLLGGVALSWDMQVYSNHLLLTTLMCGFLAFARSDEAWSISAALRKRDARPVPWWPQFLMMSQLSICYLFAGLSKVNPVWLSGNVLEHFIWWPMPAIAFQAMAVATIVIEVFTAVGLWIRAARRVAIVLGMSLHFGIIIMVRDPVPLVAFALVCVSVYPLYVTRPLPGSPEQGDRLPAHDMAS